MNLNKLLVLVVGALLSLTAMADTVEANIKKLLQPRIGEGGAIESVIKTPYGGLYEVKIGNELVYTDAEAKFVFIGRVIDAETSKDFTQSRLDEINRIKFTDLPLESALKTVKGSGKRVVAVFEDPNCGYCKRFRKTLNDTKDITIYTFMYNILSDDSRVKSKNVWCSAERSKVWDDWMLNGKVPATASDSCAATPNEKILELGRKLKVTGTPTIFFADGSRLPGAVDAKTLEAKLASLK
jgi:thiol:disulfide interchange protein DsbC